MPSEAAKLYQHYVNAFAAIPEQERRDILEAVLDAEVEYKNPSMEGTGHQTIVDDIHIFQSKFPGGQFTLRSISEHHNVALMEWQLVNADGTLGVRGHDAVRINPEGKFASIVTFAPSTILEQQAS